MNKILIIDDDRELCALIKRSVQAENIEADFCNTGKEGLQKLKEQERLLPRGIVLMSPWTDLTGEGKTFQTKAELDPVLDKEYIDRMTRAYAPDRDLTDPYISPLFGNFHGFPPVYIQVGENEILLDDSLRLYKNLIKAGVAAHIDRFPGMWHVFQMSPFKKASEAMDKNAEFIYSVCR